MEYTVLFLRVNIFLYIYAMHGDEVNLCRSYIAFIHPEISKISDNVKPVQ